MTRANIAFSLNHARALEVQDNETAEEAVERHLDELDMIGTAELVAGAEVEVYDIHEVEDE